LSTEVERAQVNIGIVLLAAGSSSRMGRSKQLLNIHGKSLLSISLEAATNSNAIETVVVLGANEEAHRKVVSNFQETSVIANPAWENGMGNSLKTGLNFLLSKAPSIEGVIIMVCDQPLITEHQINKIIEEHIKSSKPIIASNYAGTAGVPVLFAKSYFEKLLDLKDDQGAKILIRKNSSDVTLVDFPDGAIDLDTMDEYQKFINSRQGK
jgi:molybdenum cofactor cytidylyltransferase